MKHLTIMTALMAEALPLLNYYKMVKRPKSAHFHWFEATNFDLIVCGIGANKTQFGLDAYCNVLDGDYPRRWLNLGIAGARTLPIGQLVWPGWINSSAIGRFDQAGAGFDLRVKSLAEPSVNYQDGILFDMEAETCLRAINGNSSQFIPEDFFCAKVISDNQFVNALKTDKQWVSRLIEAQIEALDINIIKLIKT